MNNYSWARKLLNLMHFSPLNSATSLGLMFQNVTDKPPTKWDGYIQHYERHFFPLRNKPVNILEIGIQAGNSLEVWAKYFRSAINIIGCDIDPHCADINFEDSRIHALIGDINDQNTLSRLDSLATSLDIIIDDGSHQSNDIVKSFIQLFPRLSEDGIYLIEDLHCSYWQNFGGGLYDHTSAISFFKKIVDVVNRESWGTDIEYEDFFVAFVPMLSSQGLPPNFRFLDEIHSIEFVNSICVVRKRSIKHNVLGQRNLAHSPLRQDSSSNNNQAFGMLVPNQKNKAFSSPLNNNNQNETLPSTSADEISRLKQEIFKLEENATALETQLYQATKQFYDATVTIQQLEENATALETQFYQATKQFYDASVTIQQLEFKIKQLEQPNDDAV